MQINNIQNVECATRYQAVNTCFAATSISFSLLSRPCFSWLLYRTGTSGDRISHDQQFG
ncbi:hypothetical protein [Anabaena azotica]|uniref:hypothetical protein n=1 Tax=Anabaena azotica TaxID=197653 RepID=UPI0016867955|nr:hypothetical protein [Anabaena azotica]